MARDLLGWGMRPEFRKALRALFVAAMLVMAPHMLLAALPAVQGQVKKDFARIVFSWPERVPFRASMQGRTLKVTFDKQANPNLGALTSHMSAYVESASMAPDGRTALITLRHPYPVRTFISSNTSGIDLLQINSPRFQGKSSVPATTAEAAPPAASPAKTSLTAPPKPAPAAKPAARKRIEVAQAKPIPKPLAKPIPSTAEVKKPAATKKKLAVLKAPEPAPAKELAKEKETASASTPTPARARETPSDQTFPTPMPAPISANTKAVAQAAPAAAPAAPAQPEAPAVAASVAAPAGGRGLMVAVLKKSTAAEFSFPWTERVAAAAFTYGPDVWMVFSKPAQIDVAALQSLVPSFIQRIEQLPSNDSTILRFGLSENMHPIVHKAANSYEWTVALSRRSRAPADPVVAEIRTKPPVKPHLFLPVLEAAKIITLKHPQTGEDLEILPIYKPGQGVFPERSFVDARLPRTAQGVVVVPVNADLRVAKLRNGVRIGTPEGLRLATLPQLDLKTYLNEEESGDSFFPYEKWKVADASELSAREQSLRQAITDASDPKASRLRKQLAELYLGEGLYVEALSVLNFIRQTDPDYYKDYQLSALHGAANFMTQRIPEAALDFADPVLEGNEEIDYWKRFTALMNGNENKLIKYAEFNDQFGRQYPPDMRRRLALIAADQAVGQGMYQAALNILKSLPKEIMEPIAPYRDFMIGRIYAETGQFDKAKDALTKLLDTTDDRFLRARTAFTLATTRFKAGEIDKMELMRELDGLRIVWRGDQLEVSLLDLLGNLYAGEKQYVEALRAWKDLVDNYPGTPLAQEVAVKMSQTFAQLFRDGNAEDMPPLQALALYYEFKELTPIGSDGDTMIQDLANRLAAVDLLDRAEALLEHQVMHRLEKGERSRVGARLAGLYLLDKKPDQAIQVLELTGYGNNPPELEAARNRLAASAYASTGDWKTALAMLESDFTPESKLIQMDIHWDNKDWPSVITLGEDMLASRSNITAPMNDEEARTLMRLAIAYTMEGDRLQLQYLRDYFTPLMAESPYRASFDYITDDNGPIDPRNIAQLAADISKTKAFLETYRASLEKDNAASSAVN
jgi:lipopolysaccharide biosynthesis regulator YciM